MGDRRGYTGSGRGPCATTDDAIFFSHAWSLCHGLLAARGQCMGLGRRQPHFLTLQSPSRHKIELDFKRLLPSFGGLLLCFVWGGVAIGNWHPSAAHAKRWRFGKDCTALDAHCHAQNSTSCSFIVSYHHVFCMMHRTGCMMAWGQEVYRKIGFA